MTFHLKDQLRELVERSNLRVFISYESIHINALYCNLEQQCSFITFLEKKDFKYNSFSAEWVFDCIYLFNFKYEYVDYFSFNT